MGDRRRGASGRGRRPTPRPSPPSWGSSRCASRFACRRRRRTSDPGSIASGWRSICCNEVDRRHRRGAGRRVERRGGRRAADRRHRPDQQDDRARCASTTRPRSPSLAHASARNRIPLERGLGSSSAAVVAGVAAALALARREDADRRQRGVRARRRDRRPPRQRRAGLLRRVHDRARTVPRRAGSTRTPTFGPSPSCHDTSDCRPSRREPPCRRSCPVPTRCSTWHTPPSRCRP